jgi:hypothetical protein
MNALSKNFPSFKPNLNAGSSTHTNQTVGATSQTLATIMGASLDASTQVVQISVDDFAIRIAFNATATATKGHLINPQSGLITLTREEADVAQFIRVTSSANIQVVQGL